MGIIGMCERSTDGHDENLPSLFACVQHGVRKVKPFPDSWAKFQGRPASTTSMIVCSGSWQRADLRRGRVLPTPAGEAVLLRRCEGCQRSQSRGQMA